MFVLPVYDNVCIEALQNKGVYHGDDSISFRLLCRKRVVPIVFVKPLQLRLLAG